MSSVLPFVPQAEFKVDEYIYRMPIEGLWYIDHKVFADDRGFYAELGRVPELDKVLPAPFKIKQLNLSHSNKYVARGFHAEDWNKLLTVTQGTVFAVWVDIRVGSPTFGQAVSMEIGKDNGTPWGSVYVSSGIANSFCCMTETADYLYAVDQLYAERNTSLDVAISLFDPDINASWPFPKEQLKISDRDKNSITLRERFPEQFTA